MRLPAEGADHVVTLTPEGKKNLLKDIIDGKIS
jgi:hypothetical protein